MTADINPIDFENSQINQIIAVQVRSILNRMTSVTIEDKASYLAFALGVSEKMAEEYIAGKHVFTAVDIYRMSQYLLTPEEVFFDGIHQSVIDKERLQIKLAELGVLL